ncbi:MAG: sensor histidine kinase N-terminal domain-containing protein [Ideonella sp.]|nr:sensor histidine kinase N-terminal domain-containing protein [Ideonella sp.]MCC7455392.1 sensor histidine kinase N-terminal domain-containing protein [Nitrospira sp.]
MRSLRLRLFVFLLTLAAVAALAVGGATYSSVRRETDELFDYHLRQMALSLRDQGRIADSERAVLENTQFDYVVQVWSVDGVVLYSTVPAPVLPARAVLGFSTVAVNGAPWRIYAAATALRIVQVGQPLAARRAVAAAAAWRGVLPIALAAPIVGLALWWLVGASLAPLGRVVRALRERDVNALEPLSLQGLPSELTPLIDAFNALLARLGAAFDAQRDFTADAAHELRTPLTALKLQLGLLRDARDDAERGDAVARLQAGVERARHLVEQLLALARAEPGATAVRARLDLSQVARQAVADSAAQAAAQGGTVTLETAAPVMLDGDADALRSLVRNLVDNALKYGGTPPRVRVQVERSAGSALLRVDDAGPGIAAAERERVFDRFHRREPGRGSGSGLGLSIVRAVARAHGGSVQLADSSLGGLRVELRLPGMPG